MKIVLFDTAVRRSLFPLTLNKAIADLRFGIFTVKERWERLLNVEVYVHSADYLTALYLEILPGDYILIDSSIIPTAELVEEIKLLQLGQCINDSDGPIAGRVEVKSSGDIRSALPSLKASFINTSVRRLTYPHQLFLWNAEMICFDFDLIKVGAVSQTVNETVQVIKPENIFIEEGAALDHCILNATSGPIYIARDATIMEGSLVRGPFVLGEAAVLKMGTKVYAGTTIGPSCIAGGEIKNSIMMGYSNKAHDGYLGDSVIGEWCNMGAGTSNSNLKNTGGSVGLYNYDLNAAVNAGNKCGVIIGDYSRTAINTSINTGTVIGLCCNVFAPGLTPKFIPDFSWGVDGSTKYRFDKAITDINNWKRFKNKQLSGNETAVLKHIFDAGYTSYT